jgi:hypothetical protein
MKIIFGIFFNLSISCLLYKCYFIPAENKHNISSINSFIFGSCYNGINKHKSRYDIFETIDRHNPDFFMWLGDAAYVRYYSTERIKLRYKILNYILRKWKPLNETKIEKKFNETKYNPCKYKK